MKSRASVEDEGEDDVKEQASKSLMHLNNFVQILCDSLVLR